MFFWKTGFCRRAGHCIPVSGFLSNPKDNWISLLLSVSEVKKEGFGFFSHGKDNTQEIKKEEVREQWRSALMVSHVCLLAAASHTPSILSTQPNWLSWGQLPPKTPTCLYHKPEIFWAVLEKWLIENTLVQFPGSFVGTRSSVSRWKKHKGKQITGLSSSLVFLQLHSQTIVCLFVCLLPLLHILALWLNSRQFELPVPMESLGGGEGEKRERERERRKRKGNGKGEREWGIGKRGKRKRGKGEVGKERNG